LSDPIQLEARRIAQLIRHNHLKTIMEEQEGSRERMNIQTQTCTVQGNQMLQQIFLEDAESLRNIVNFHDGKSSSEGIASSLKHPLLLILI